MQITREQVEKRRALLIEARLQAAANVNACNGAIEDCEFWMKCLDAEETVGAKPAAGPAAAEG